MEWISVNDRLPEYGQDVLVHNPDWDYNNKVLAGCRLRILGWSMWPKPIHWMPFPEPPAPIVPPQNEGI